MKNDCVFCAIAAGEIPSFKIYEDDFVLAFLDINPFSEGHTLVIPKEHYKGLLDVPPQVLAVLLERVQKISSHIAKALACDGFNILQNNGAAAGQSVNHIHFHIVPRMEGSVLSFESGKGDMEKLSALASRLRLEN
jgi:histidine triad (HIT) family protein